MVLFSMVRVPAIKYTAVPEMTLSSMLTVPYFSKRVSGSAPELDGERPRSDTDVPLTSHEAEKRVRSLASNRGAVTFNGNPTGNQR